MIANSKSVISKPRRQLPISISIKLLFGLALLLQTIIFSTGSALAQANNVDQITTKSKTLEQTVSIVTRISSASDLADEALASARVKFQNIVGEASGLLRKIDAQIAVITTRLTEIGPPPQEDAPPEPSIIKETRMQLNADKASLAAAKTALENLVAQADARISDISLRRQMAFTQAIFKRTTLNWSLVSNALANINAEIFTAKALFSNWISFVIDNKFWQAIVSTVLSLVTAVFLSFNFNRLFGTYLDQTRTDPNYFKRLFTAFWATILPSAAIAIFLFTSFGLFSYFEIFSTKIQQITLALIILISGSVFAWHIAKAIFAPDHPNWRLIKMSNAAARKMFWLTFVLLVTQAVGYLLQTVNAVLSGTVSVTAFQGLITALIIGSILIAMALITRSDHASTAPDKRQWPKFLSIPVILIGGAIIISATAGYIGLARFIAQQVIVTGAIITLMIMGILSARELSREGIFSSTALGRHLLTRRNMEALSVEQISLAVSLIFIFIVAALGIPAILMQWGTTVEEIWDFIKRAFTGIEIGNFRLSLSSMLFGVIIFIIVIAITRLVQRWLRNTVFPRSRADIGVTESVNSGLGYLGFGIAAVLGITSAGVDLSSLALVAGALSLGIGFGLQNIVSNFVSGLILLVERPIKVGDWINVGGAEGTVKRISVRATEIETFQRKSIIVPNSELINSQVGNWTLKSKNGRVDISVGVAYGSDVRLVEKILIEIAEAHPLVAKKPEPNVWFTNFGESSLDFTLRMFLSDITNRVPAETAVRFEIIRRFAEAGIEIPFPQRDVNMKYPNEALSQVVAAETKPAAGKRKPVSAARKKSG